MRNVLTLALCGLAALPLAAQDDHGDHIDEDGDMQQLTVTTAPVQEDVAMVCTFAQECFDTEGCSETTYSFDLDAHAGGMDDVTLLVEAMVTSEAGDVFLMGARDAGTYLLSGGGFEGRHMLTVTADGAARYTVHFPDGPMMINYAGQCEASE